MKTFRKMFRDKRGSELVTESAIGIVLVVVFFGIMFLGVSRVSDNTALYEQVYSKEIALAIDSSYPGMTLSYDLFEISERISRVGIENVVSFRDNRVTVRLKEDSGGYSTKYFSDYSLESGFDSGNVLKISIGGKNE
tara:strand:+ start:2514 stop:2924 length:411 start_codon:yes stop_codon:yes gene_type:complete